MAHLTYIEDEHGNIEDVEVFCSDYCAKASEYYQGWNGCNEISVTEPCFECGARVNGLDEYGLDE